ncbi:MAG: class I SAM-dependent methyltransferase [Lentisphaerae bacterium]|nr:class I SAM-dependent methyltransferase [Lentisphaerota bacterium]
MTEAVHIPTPAEQAHMFRKSLPHKVRLQEILRALGDVEDLTCLEVGADNGAFSLALRKHGGNWQTVVWSEDEAAAVGAALGEKVNRFEESGLPFKKKLFDVVVVSDILERFRDDIAFIEECHKVLKPDGRLIVSVNRLGAWRPVEMLRSALGLTYQKRGFVRPGYTESELFRVLKSGFDVHLVRPYSRFFVELTDAIFARIVEKRRADGEAGLRRLVRAYTVAGVCYTIAFQLDVLMLLSRGYHFIAMGKRRAWRPRNAPVLVDGRSITEAVLSRAPT